MKKWTHICTALLWGMALTLCSLLLCPQLAAQEHLNMPVRGGHPTATQATPPDSGNAVTRADRHARRPVLDAQGDTVKAPEVTLTGTVQTDTVAAGLGHLRIFNPDPMRAMWLSALCPGLGQIYNRRYWKLPIIVGAFVGLGYGTQWNNRMLSDYSKGYRDLLDDDPTTRSYMDFFPKTVKESDLDASWLKSTLKNKKNYYRRYRDICIFSLIGVYILNVVDAYVDASLSHFDVSDDLSLDVSPAVIGGSQYVVQSTRTPSLGMQVNLNF